MAIRLPRAPVARGHRKSADGRHTGTPRSFLSALLSHKRPAIVLSLAHDDLPRDHRRRRPPHASRLASIPVVLSRLDIGEVCMKRHSSVEVTADGNENLRHELATSTVGDLPNRL